MKNTDFRSETLTCGCCGTWFKTRPSYKDQDQDKGYGICKPCQKEDAKRNSDRYEETFRMIYNSLKPENKANMDQRIKEYGKERKIVIVNRALDAGLIKWNIG